MTNQLQHWISLLNPAPRRSIVEVLTVNADGSSVVQFNNGSVVTVRGSSVAEGEKAFLVDGEIRGVAPNLDSETIVVG